MPATLAGCVSIFSGFTLFTAYERSAFPEFAGGFWLPLIILLCRFAIVAIASAPSLFAAHSTVPPFRSPSPLPAHGSRICLSASSPAICWPALHSSGPSSTNPGRRCSAPLSQHPRSRPRRNLLASRSIRTHWVDISQATQDPGYNFENNWLFARHTNPMLALHDNILRQVSWIAVSMIAVALAAIADLLGRGTLPHQKSSAALLVDSLAAIPVVVLFLLFPISRPLWYLLPEMRFLQYPWRWLEAVEAPMAIFFVAAIWPQVATPAAMKAPTAARFPAAADSRRAKSLCSPPAPLCSSQLRCMPRRSSSRSAIPKTPLPPRSPITAAGAGFEGMYEYDLPEATSPAIATGFPDACLVSDPSVVLGKPGFRRSRRRTPSGLPNQGSLPGHIRTGDHGAQTNPEHRILHAVMPHSGLSGSASRQLLPSWHIRLNGRVTERAIGRRDDGLIVVPVPQGPVDRHHRLDNDARRPRRPHGSAASACSCSSLCSDMNAARPRFRLT